jgi:DNA-binding winged helix-turn-helix (wHTH) protein/tetratricopeptide (TPR) repeat protein
MAGRECYEFGEFLLDAAERRLSRAGQPIQLAPKTHDVLVALLRRAGGLVTKRELLTQVWPEAFVDEGILAVHVSALRRALNGGGGARYIETVSRSGYRFAAPVMERHSTQPPAVEVTELCRLGRAHLRAASMYETPKARAAFRAAIVLDPTYAAAHAGLALACCAQAQFRMAPFSDAYAEAKAAALRALAMDTSCAAAQTALGAVLFFSEWDWLAAERSLRRALDLDPEQTEAYLLYGQLLEALGKLESGLAMKRKALELEPLSPLVHFALSLSYWNQRQYDESIGWANKTLELDPSHPHTREFLAGAYLKKGDFDRWLAENLAHAQSHGVPAAALDPLINAYAKGGPAGVAKLIVERGSSQPQAFPPMQLAIQYAEIGDLDSAFQHLERAIDSRDPGLVYLAVAPQWDSLRADPRFLHCLGRMGLSPVRQS